MSDIQSKMEKILAETKKIRDELIVQVNLGKLEAKNELSSLDDKLELYKEKTKHIAEVAGDTASELKIAAELGIESSSKEDAGTAIVLAAEELKKGYQRIKNLI